MKSKRKIIIIISLIAIVIIGVVRLVSNKRSFREQLKMISEFNATIPVITDTVKYEQITEEFIENGSFSPMRELSISAETQGRIISLNAEVGDNVKVSQILASVENELFKAQLEQAKLSLENADGDMKRFEQLSKGDAVTVQQYEASKLAFINAQSAYTSARLQFDNSFIKAPFDGVITKRNVEKGSYISPGTAVFNIVEIDKVKFVARLTEEEVGKVKEGQSVKVIVDAYQGVIYNGTVNTIVITADQSKRYEVNVVVTNRSDKFIRPGMFGSAIFEGQFGEKILVIPRKAINGSIKSPEVFIVKGDSVLSQSIDIATINDRYIAVKQGLKAGDVIVVSGQINLVNGSKVKVK